MKNKFFITIFLVLSFLLTFAFFQSDLWLDRKIQRELKQLSDTEKEYLGNFFQYLMRLSSFGHVLFGEKPMGVDSCPIAASPSVEGIDYMDDAHIMDRHRFKEGYETWKKQQQRFPSSNFTIMEYPLITHDHQTSPHFIEICLINQRLFLKTVKKHIKDFQAVLGSNVTPQAILKDYLKKGPYFWIIRNHEGLFGTLLGYGRNNAWKFKEEIELEFSKRSTVVIGKENPQEIYLFLPHFHGLPNTQETLILEEQYKQERKQIEKIYQNKDFLTPSLKKIMQGAF